MSSVFWFQPLPTVDAPQITLWVNDEPITARAGWTLAAALLANGITTTRYTAIDQQPRGPFCMMGVCFECRVTVDDIPNVQSCMTPVRDGMRVTLPQGVRALS